MTKRTSDAPEPKTLSEYLRLFFTGFAMGAADIVPGVSGGTMAFILGVYEMLINAIKSFNLDAVRLLSATQIQRLARPRFPALPAGIGPGLGVGDSAALQFSQQHDGRSRR